MALRRHRLCRLRRAPAPRARAGRYLGIGIGNGVKGTGRGPFESGIVRIGRSGRISVYTGAMPMGQGIKTALAQICAEQFAVRHRQRHRGRRRHRGHSLRPGRLRQPADRHRRLGGASRRGRGAGKGAERRRASAGDRRRGSRIARRPGRGGRRARQRACRCAKSPKRSPACRAMRCRENSSPGSKAAELPAERAHLRHGLPRRRGRGRRRNRRRAHPALCRGQ